MGATLIESNRYRAQLIKCPARLNLQGFDVRRSVLPGDRGPCPHLQLTTHTPNPPRPLRALKVSLDTYLTHCAKRHTILLTRSVASHRGEETPVDQAISVGLGLLILAVATVLMALAQAMRKGKLPPNSWAGIRTKVAFESNSSWYEVQRSGSTPLMCLAIAYIDSSLLFIIQGIYHDTISELIPITVLTIQSLIGIIWIYRASRNPHPSQQTSNQDH